MTELLTMREAGRVLKMTQKEIIYNVNNGKLPALKIQKTDGSEDYRFSLPMIEDVMKSGTVAEKSILKGYQPGRLCRA